MTTMMMTTIGVAAAADGRRPLAAVCDRGGVSFGSEVRQHEPK